MNAAWITLHLYISCIVLEQSMFSSVVWQGGYTCEAKGTLNNVAQQKNMAVPVEKVHSLRQCYGDGEHGVAFLLVIFCLPSDSSH